MKTPPVDINYTGETNEEHDWFKAEYEHKGVKHRVEIQSPEYRDRIRKEIKEKFDKEIQELTEDHQKAEEELEQVKKSIAKQRKRSQQVEEAELPRQLRKLGLETAPPSVIKDFKQRQKKRITEEEKRAKKLKDEAEKRERDANYEREQALKRKEKELAERTKGLEVKLEELYAVVNDSVKVFMGEGRKKLPDRVVYVFKAFLCLIQGVDRDLRPPGGLSRTLELPNDKFMDFFRDYLGRKKGDLKAIMVILKEAFKK